MPLRSRLFTACLPLAAGVIALCLGGGAAGPARAAPAHAIAILGEPALPAGFDHLPYVDPDAPQGGVMRYGVYGTFDNLNPVIVKSALTTARGLWLDREFGNLVFEPLMQRSVDEPFTMYGLLAETVETDPDRSYVEFQLNPKAKFSDGEPVRPEDVLFTVDMLRQYGRPIYANWLRPAVKIEKVGAHGVRFTFDNTADRETPLLIAGLPVLPEHAFDHAQFGNTTLKPVIGSGPYVIADVQPGQRITYKKNPDYWGKDLPIKRGLDNYDEISIDYFRDANAQFEAFKKGLFYVYLEGNPRHWQTAYDFPAAGDGRVVKESFQTKTPVGMRAFVFNTRRKVFSDVRVRKALSLLFDFEWANANLYYGAYKRTESFFEGSELSSIGKPASDREKQLLAPYADELEPDVMAGTYHPAVSDGSGSDRTLLREAVNELKAAGYDFKGRQMVGPDGAPLGFEIMVQTAEEERIASAYQRTLARIGVAVSIRQPDDATYQQRKQDFDYDMLLFTYYASLSPGVEQVGRWGSSSKDAPGSFNYAGVGDPGVDALIAKMVTATTREEFVDTVRAYDRLLISGHYVVPLFNIGEQWLARWSFIQHPDVTPITGYYLPAFWRDSKAQ
ncbi:extracellular solute-binding protein [Aurantimonas sp. MSK8Z-1]|uniref:extracellular solute-binding protein n=1 Tax=Mangrovibrevibacter kandeliae TaxID=2968473 RepID=UPI002118A18B|nr:extracellular solute-binding protein [Aurantimonas sp. MSK8Z-1]MCW4114564.1 extracellular solute-binding protein [Aurantimonas sp. MSK8Z-1]